MFLNHRKNKESTLTKWNDLNLYNCLQVIVKTITLCMKCLVVQDNLAFVKKNMKKIYNAIVSREMLKLLTFTQYSKKIPYSA